LGELGRLRHLGETKQVVVKGARLFFLTDRHGELHVIDGDDAHVDAPRLRASP
jgi:hypothetical protein